MSLKKIHVGTGVDWEEEGADWFPFFSSSNFFYQPPSIDDFDSSLDALYYFILKIS